MNRRGFIGTMIAALSTAVLDPEKLLWVPGQRLISIPAPPQRWVFNNNIRISALQFNGIDGQIRIHRDHPTRNTLLMEFHQNKRSILHWSNPNYGLIATPDHPIIIEPEFRQSEDANLWCDYLDFDSGKELHRTGTFLNSITLETSELEVSE